MDLQHAFFQHIVSGASGEDASLLARVALHLGFDPRAYPVALAEIGEAGKLPRDIRTYALTELLLGEYVRLCSARAARPWTALEVEKLRLAAGVAATAKLYAIVS